MAGKKASLATCLLAGITVLGFAIRVLAPLGYMPGSANGGALFVPCPVQNPRLEFLLANLSGQDSHHHQHSESSSSAMGDCAFAAASGSVLPTVGLSLADLNRASLDFVTDRPERASTSPILSYRPRGPPQLFA